MNIKNRHPIQEPLMAVLTKSLSEKLDAGESFGLAAAVVFIGHVTDEIGLERTNALLRLAMDDIKHGIDTTISAIAAGLQASAEEDATQKH